MEIPFFLSKNEIIYNEFKQYKKCQNLSFNEIISLGNIAWHTGILASLNTPKIPIFELISDNDITLNASCYTLPKNRIIFSSYNYLDNNITLYKNTIEKYFIPSIPAKYTSYSNYEYAISLLICHEFFHFLQCHNLYSLSIYPLDCLNEIAAYSFARNRDYIYFE